ncbi:ATP-dependent DNA helicase RuvA [Methanocalculus chunghsingensis]|uniref:ATP-dependent DNA helicase RuvA n=1 Tax=Methanocalculus chunghsingensis TaxID=156457 RepID=A0A8J7W5L3_9EURY|nr:Holliday junction branch migration protein RuvA [Methanocalculus chunghsingensis]MBR1368764.1 ATP-dependent DNA helicase RuvA [Methanocalculus chunghsingensis]
MFAHISGSVASIGEGSVVIDVGGIGYLIRVSQPDLREIREMSNPVKLHTHLVVREDAVSLYGFLHPGERDLFLILINVSGIGPQIALNILSQISLDQFAMAIISEDEKMLTRISGIGPKSAKRLILELKETMKKRAGTLRKVASPQPASDAISALITLGFSEREADEAVRSVTESEESQSVQVIIKAALARLRERSE